MTQTPTRFELLINGRWKPAASGRTARAMNPALGEPLAEFAVAGAADVDEAVRAARAAFDDGPWPWSMPAERARLLYKIAELIRRDLEELARLETRNVGKPIADSRDEIGAAAGCFEYYAGALGKFGGETIPVSKRGLDYTLRQPIGVVAAVVPWNFPFLMAAWKCAPALAVGNAVILKPASLTPLTALRMGEIILEAGAPEGVFSVVTGPGSEVGQALVTHPGVDKISFTGETTTGAEIMRTAGADLKRVSLELGGKSPNIVFADADVDRAARTSVLAVFGNTGQDCCARSRAFVERSVYGQFVEAFIDQTSKIVIGDPMDDKTQIGPMVSPGQRELVCEYIRVGRAEGATLAYGGDIPAGPLYDKGAFIRPAVFTNARNDMRTSREEIFGPVLNVIPFDDEAAMIREANDGPYGLSGSIWTNNVSRALRVARRVNSGVLSVNCNNSVHIEAPFGGMKKSGLGRDLGMHGLMNFTEVKNIFIAELD